MGFPAVRSVAGPLSVGGVGEAHAVASGHEDVGVVHQPVNESASNGAGYELVEP